MASVLGAIRAYIVAQIQANTTINSCTDAHSAKGTNYPIAVMAWDEGTYSPELNNSVTLKIPFRVKVESRDPEEIDIALEEIDVLFLDVAQKTALAALSVNLIQPVGFIPPTPGEGTQMEVLFGMVEMEVQIERSYT